MKCSLIIWNFFFGSLIVKKKHVMIFLTPCITRQHHNCWFLRLSEANSVHYREQKNYKYFFHMVIN